MHFSDHLAEALGQICLMPGQVSRDYMEWFFMISNLFMTTTQAGDQPRHPPVPQHEAYVEPAISEVPMAAEGGLSQASDPPRHVVVRLVALMFYKMLVILNVVINVFL